jgi:hypothetical protein
LISLGLEREDLMDALSEILALSEPYSPFVSSGDIPDEHLKTILRASGSSGGSGFLLVCRDRALIKKVACCANAQDLLLGMAYLIIAGQRQSSFPMSRTKSLSFPTFKSSDHSAEADLIGSIDLFLTASCGETGPEQMMKTAMAVTRIIQQASSLGIGSYCEYKFEKNRIMELCGIPSKENDILCLVGLGCPSDGSRNEKETEVTLFRDHYGSNWRQQ